jgi:hypothetical protein
MVYTLSYRMYKYEHGLTAAEQGAADVRAGEAAAALRDLPVHLGRTFRPRRRVRSARDAMTASVRVLPRVRWGRGDALHADPRGRPGPSLGVGR